MTLKKNTSNLTEQVSDNDEAISETSDLLEEAITDVNSLEDNLETISEYVGQMIEESGDLSGDLNNLLNQVNELDEIIEGVNSTIVNIEGNLHAHEDTDNDGITNAQDTDDDNDGTPDSQDAFPEDPDETTDTDNEDPVRLPFFNMLHKFNDTSVNGSGDGKSSAATIVKTNGDGKFKAMNFFGFGRAATGLRGIVPGSVNIKFFTEGGYVYAGLAGLNANTESGLSASTSYAFNITIDEGTAQTNVQFSVDATNTKFGGTNGVISKMQAALDAQTANVSSNMTDKQVTVAIVDGDLRITSESNMEHTGVVLSLIHI